MTRGLIATLFTALIVTTSSSLALAQKAGGVLKVTHRDNPPSASITLSSDPSATAYLALTWQLRALLPSMLTTT